ncbi:uncharacterized protein [Blastocystis hominis]|uniref:AAA+ ATPase domain-containing protein n=1 Tax=Blastocystis hominis TaxID=12968 RepID=D8LVX1_BLAHO|nr:uncharacterized protein [Blastocystis hominis]CBK19960.2 unnamed protein product [Blastocystis hominis]|eukprot:XP_012894008.1 uncharacterized protein [Blastocystis hominis]
MSKQELRDLISAVQTQNRSLVSLIDDFRRRRQELQKEIDALENQLTRSIRLPYLVASISEVLSVRVEDEENLSLPPEKQEYEEGVIMSTIQKKKVFVASKGMLYGQEIHPGDLVGINKDTCMLYQLLPTEYDKRVKAMLLEEKPSDDYTDIGGLDKQIQELQEAVVLPLTRPELFTELGIRAPKGILLYGPPGTGKTLLARACAKQTDAAFIKLSATVLDQAHIGEGSRIVRDCFSLAKKKIEEKQAKGSIIFIDELDAIGIKRSGDGEGSHEVQRTLLELLNAMDGFSSDSRIKVIAATNRPDILDPALLRSGRFDRKVELPNPNEEARVKILQIHSKKLVLNRESVNFEEIARCTEDFSGAMLRAVCVEAGMLALRRGASAIEHEDFMEGIGQVASRKKANLMYYS